MAIAVQSAAKILVFTGTTPEIESGFDRKIRFARRGAEESCRCLCVSLVT
ncbi:MAG: hypothetical protein MZU97_24695 [Bacillus subtilis]|nr:hypothetical protein [Bacillus subtilis]